MKLSWKTYGVLAVIFLASTVTAVAIRANGIFEGVLATPAVLALLGALYKLFQDEVAHVKALAIQHDQQRFALGITSHMADVAFDKHVALCDDFVRELYVTLQCLMTNPFDHEGAKQRADVIGDTIRRHVMWITPALQIKLETFQSAVREISAKAYMAKNHPNLGDPQEPLNLLLNLIDTGSAPGSLPNRELMHVQIIELAREMLGVKELTELRASLLKNELLSLHASKPKGTSGIPEK